MDDFLQAWAKTYEIAAHAQYLSKVPCFIKVIHKSENRCSVTLWHKKCDRSIILSVASAITMFADPPQSRSTFPSLQNKYFWNFPLGFVSFSLANLNLFLEWYVSVCVQWNLVVLIITLVVVVIILFDINCKCPHAGCSSETIGIIGLY